MIPRLILSMALRPDSARDDHLLLFMTLEPTSDDETEAWFWWRHWARPASISRSRRWGLLLTLMIMMPRPTSAHSDHDAEAYLWPWYWGLLLVMTQRCIVCPRRNRKEETVMARLHIGHSFITHSYLLKGEEPPMCIGCDKRLTVEHILLTCSDFIEIREPFYS